MKITGKTEEDRLILVLEGVIDSTNAEEAQEEFNRITADNPATLVTIDAAGLEYISSAGLRVILNLVKSGREVSVIHPSEAIYDVFDITGFTNFINIEK